jgi:hypothetical protein
MINKSAKKVFLKTFGWPLVQVARDDIGVTEEVEY